MSALVGGCGFHLSVHLCEIITGFDFQKIVAQLRYLQSPDCRSFSAVIFIPLRFHCSLMNVFMSSVCLLSANKEELPDNEQEKASEKEMAEGLNEETEMVRGRFITESLIFSLMMPETNLIHYLSGCARHQ